MPPAKKIDTLPPEIREWLNNELKQNGPQGYDDLTQRLNGVLSEHDLELTIGKTAVHNYGKEYHEYIKFQKEAGDWAAGWMQEAGLGDEAQRHSVLFQMITTLAFKVMKAQMAEGMETSAQDLAFLGKMMKDIMTSSGMREKMIEAERERAAQEVRETANANLDAAVEAGNIEQSAAQAAREVMGFA